MDINKLSPESHAGLIQALAVLRARRAAGLHPQQLAALSGIPEMEQLPEGTYQTTPASIASMVARRDKADAAPSLDDFSATPLMNGSDEALVRSQYLRGGSAAASILEKKDGPRPQLVNGQMSYAGVQPVKSSQDLIANPKFQQLVQSDPQKASSLYKALTGGDFTSDYKEQEKQRIAMTTGYEGGIREGLLNGTLRRHPEMGWLERRRSVPNLDPTKPPQEFWEPVDASVHAADAQFGERATGMARPQMATVLDNVAPHARNAFLAEFYNQTNAGKTAREALTAANSVANNLPSSPAALATLQAQQQQPPSPPSKATASAPPVAYPEQAIANGIAGAGKPIADWIGSAMDEIPRGLVNTGITAGNVANSLMNFPTTAINTVGAMFGSQSRVADPLPQFPLIQKGDLSALFQPVEAATETAAQTVARKKAADDYWAANPDAGSPY